MEREFYEAVSEIAAEIGLESVTRKVWDSPAVRFDQECIAAVRAGIARAGFTSRDIISGAGHDAAYIARIVPTTMIFVPSAGGLSHNEAESTTFEECAAGAQVLLNAVLEYDRRFASS
jgi:N-carbamoyl-L-amino-acid hydrolase